MGRPWCLQNQCRYWLPSRHRRARTAAGTPARATPASDAATNAATCTSAGVVPYACPRRSRTLHGAHHCCDRYRAVPSRSLSRAAAARTRDLVSTASHANQNVHCVLGTLTTILAPGLRSASSRAMLTPTMPPPTTTKSARSPAGRGVPRSEACDKKEPHRGVRLAAASSRNDTPHHTTHDRQLCLVREARGTSRLTVLAT